MYLLDISIDMLISNNIVSKPTIRSIEETIDHIINNNASVSRYGDGEFQIMVGRDISFQKASPEIKRRLEEVQISCIPNHLVCLPDTFNGLNKKGSKQEFKKFWRAFMVKNRFKWYSYLNMKQVYYNSFISRPYMAYTDENNAKEIFIKLKKIWEHRDTIIVEGEKSRLGVGNDLLDGTHSVKRILCPSKEAFEKYNEILVEVKRYNKDCLILIALGPTATILAYDLSLEGYQAIDIGHVDIEYEWFLMGARSKIPVKDKYVNEAGTIGGHDVGSLNDPQYLGQIQKIIN